jgi:hypothetical protein
MTTMRERRTRSIWRRRAAVTIAALVVGAAAAAGAQPARVAVLEPSTSNLPGVEPHALQTAVASALAAKGVEVVPAGKIGPELAVCTAPSCYVTVAGATGATHVLRVEGLYANDGYTLQLEVWNRATGRLTRGERHHCEICAPRDMVGAAYDQTAVLWTQAATDAQAPGAAPGAVAATPPPAVPPAPHAKPIWPWIVGGVGVAALGTGIALIAMGKESACPDASYDECGKKRDLAPAGYAVGGAGLALVGAAVAGYLLSGRPTDTTVALTPNGLAIGGRF